MANRLQSARSPYLQQHASNPVDWYEWGYQAFERARSEDKPVLVSIGYSACHWCHVMAHESFENASVAQMMNDNFVNIKVDREERPDVDAVYMEAVQLMTGQGGWPLNIFLTPDLDPFFGGTYYPPAPRQGMPSWPQVLQSVAMAWRNERERVVEGAEELRSRLARTAELTSSETTLDSSILDQAFATMHAQFDATHGGFGGAPKFPQPSSLEFVLRTYRRTGDQDAFNMLTLTLDKMAAGGIRDHLGGGFHRYSVDEQWLVPHFEKMLYDNAMLARLYVNAWQATGWDSYRAVSESTLDYVLRDMTSPEGAFYSAEDADSEGVEGKFYVWTAEEIDRVMPPADAKVFRLAYGVTPEGNFEGQSILEESLMPDAIAGRTGMDPDEVESSLMRSRSRLFEERQKRVRPGRDEKILANWNALTIRALTVAGQAFGRPDYLAAADRAARFILDSMRPAGVLLHLYNQGPGTVGGFLEDYAFLIEALLDLFSASGKSEWFNVAVELGETVVERFGDASGGFFDTPESSSKELPVRPKSLFDSVTPSGNSSAANGLLRLSAWLGDEPLHEAAVRTINLVRDAMGPFSLSFGYMLSALEFDLTPPTEVVLVGKSEDGAFGQLRAEVCRRYLPNTVIGMLDDSRDRRQGHDLGLEAPSLTLFQGKQSIDGRPTGYVCESFACRRPVTEVDDLSEQLDRLAGVHA